MLVYEKTFKSAQTILIPYLFVNPQTIISVAGGSAGSYAGKIKQYIIGNENYFRIQGDYRSIEVGYQLFAPRFGIPYFLEFDPTNKLVNYRLTIIVPDTPLERIN